MEGNFKIIRNALNEEYQYYYEYGKLFIWMTADQINFKKKVHNAHSPTYYEIALKSLGFNYIGFCLSSSVQWKGKNTKVLCEKDGVLYDSYSIDSLLYAKNDPSRVSKYDSKNLLYYFNKKYNPRLELLEIPKDINQKGNSFKLKVKCEKGHIWNTTVLSQISKTKCPFCSKVAEISVDEIFSNSKKSCEERGFEFLGIYTFNKVKSILNIRCKIHNFEWKPVYTEFYKMGTGCPICATEQKDSKAVREIGKFLNEVDVKFIREYRFADCKNKKTLPFDFYLPDLNALIEYDGKQHYQLCWGR